MIATHHHPFRQGNHLIEQDKNLAAQDYDAQNLGFVRVEVDHIDRVRTKALPENIR